MKLGDFEIGMEFRTNTGQHWRCTDIGRRTILAIEIDPDLDEAWLAGPPYGVPEVVFDEIEIERAYRSTEEAILSRVKSVDDDPHPGFPNEVIAIILKAEIESVSRRYPHRRLFRFDRVDATGEILHPFDAEPVAGGWHIRVYLPFAEEFHSLPEADFSRLRPATETDLRQRTRKE